MITESRMIKNFGITITRQVKDKTKNALICKISFKGRGYALGYNGSTFYSANFLPDERGTE